MFKKIVFTFLVCVGIVYGSELVLQSANIKTHTEILGDSEIDNISNEVDASLNKDSSLESISGKISVNVKSLVSKKPDRDEHLYETLESEKFPKISFEFRNIKLLKDDQYVIIGILNLHGVNKEISSVAKISQGESLNMDGNFSLLMSEYGVEPPSLLFLTVRDRVDITYHLVLRSK